MGVLNTPALSGIKRKGTSKHWGIMYGVMSYGGLTYGEVIYRDDQTSNPGIGKYCTKLMV